MNMGCIEMSDLKSANEIIEEYSKPYSSIDNGNLYFACCTYQAEYKKLQSELAQLREKCAEYEDVIRDQHREWNQDGHCLSECSQLCGVLEKYKGKG